MDNLTAYCLSMAASLLLFWVFTWALARRNPSTRFNAGILSFLEVTLGLIFGLLGAKLTFFLIRLTYLLNLKNSDFFLTLRPEELSFFGGAAGFVLGVWLSAKILNMSSRAVLNAFAPAGAFLVAAARFSEYFLGLLGAGDYLEEITLPIPMSFPFVIGIDFSGDGSYVEYYWAIFMLECLVALVIMVVSLCHRKDPRRFTRTVFYLCLCQVFLESLRSTSITWLFVRVEQLLCFLICEGILVFRAIRYRNVKGAWIPPVVGLVVCALIVGIEFALDKTAIPHSVLYGVMAAALAGLGIAEALGVRALPPLASDDTPASSPGRT